MAPLTPLLRVDRLTRTFGERVAVDDVSFEIAAGETFGLLGPNGAGKTTTISMVAGILAADSGTVVVCGKRVSTRAGDVKSLIGIVPQDIALYADLTAEENLRFFGRLQGMGGRDLEARIADTLEVVGLADRAKDRVDEYSGGMKRRANIAVGLLHRPKLLILDEPTVGVDPQSRNQILASVEQLGSGGLAVLYTTHYMEEAERLCDRVGIIDGGRLVAQGSRRELIATTGAHDQLTITVRGDARAFAARCRALDGVLESVAVGGDVRITAIDARSVLAPVVGQAHPAGVSVTGVEVREPDLETAFLHLTGRALRDTA